MTVDDALNTALAHHRAGRLAGAERIYREVLAQHPSHPVALYFLGRIAAATGHFQHAATLLSRASTINPANADCLGILGEMYERLGRMGDAIAAYRAAAALRGDWVEVLNNLGHALQTTGRTREAIDAYESAIRHGPDGADMAKTWSNLAEAIVTLAGDRAVARAGVSILSNAGAAELIAKDLDDYVRIATDLARHPLRMSRERLRATPLMDAASFARDFAEVIRTAWRQWCGGAL
jgi:cytochrome c-type biogenesis protein CcmH/NrfG